MTTRAECTLFHLSASLETLRSLLIRLHMKPRALLCKPLALSYSVLVCLSSPRKCYQYHDFCFHDFPNPALSFTPCGLRMNVTEEDFT